MKRILFIISFFCATLIFGQSKDSSLISSCVNNVEFGQCIDLLEKESKLKVIYNPSWFLDDKVSITSLEIDIMDLIKQAVPSDEFKVYKWNGMLVILNNVELIQDLP